MTEKKGLEKKKVANCARVGFLMKTVKKTTEITNRVFGTGSPTQGTPNLFQQIFENLWRAISFKYTTTTLTNTMSIVIRTYHFIINFIIIFEFVTIIDIFTYKKLFLVVNLKNKK